MNPLRSRPASALTGGLLATVALILTGTAAPTVQSPAPATSGQIQTTTGSAATRAALGPVCLEFDTIAQGQISGFGGYCGAPLDAPGGPASLAAFDPGGPCLVKVAQPAFTGVIRNVCAWNDFWNEHAKITFPAPPPPAVDFSKDVVVAVVSGPRPNGCYGMDVSAITKDASGARTVHVREQVPCPGDGCTQVITNSFHFVKVCKSLMPLSAPIAFDLNLAEAPCALQLGCPQVAPQ